MDWWMGNLPETMVFYHEICGFPGGFHLKQSNDIQDMLDNPHGFRGY